MYVSSPYHQLEMSIGLIPLRRQLDLEALIAAVRALEALAHDRTIAKLKQESDDVLASTLGSYSLPYDPASVFLLETMVSITCQVVSHVEELWCEMCYCLIARVSFMP
jgi:hypothetical protein